MNRVMWRVGLVGLFLGYAGTASADVGFQWPSGATVSRVVSFQDYNVRVVVLGTTLLGCAAGMVGSFSLLRKRALMGDALSHATLPGIVIAFMLTAGGASGGKSLLVLLAGATVSGLVGVGVILAITRATRLKEDSALGAVLSVFFGAGVALLGVTQQIPQGSAAGLESFIYGKTASMGMADTQLIAGAAVISAAVCLLLFKELKLLCFDDGFAGSRGFSITALDVALMALLVVVTIVGLQAVGLILMIALLIIPPAAARFWTERLDRMFLISGVFGAVSGLLGALASALFPRLPSGAMIVLVCTFCFGLSMLLGAKRGVLVRGLRRRRLNRAVARRNLLRETYRLAEPNEPGVMTDQLLHARAWTQSIVGRELARAERDGLLVQSGGVIQMTPTGEKEAVRLTRQHRLWELFLQNYAEIAPSRIDVGAEDIADVVEPDVLEKLKQLLDRDASGGL